MRITLIVNEYYSLSQKNEYHSFNIDSYNHKKPSHTLLLGIRLGITQYKKIKEKKKKIKGKKGGEETKIARRMHHTWRRNRENSL